MPRVEIGLLGSLASYASTRGSHIPLWLANGLINKIAELILPLLDCEFSFSREHAMRSGCCRLPLPLFALLLVGCGPKFGLPRICEPGTASSKLALAREYDPFPDPSIAPPIVGGRPLGFMNPREEPESTRLERIQRLPATAQVYPPIAGTYAAPPSYYPSSEVIAPPATAIAPPTSPATVAYPPLISPSSATRVAPQTLNVSPPITTSSSGMQLAPLDYSKIPAATPNPPQSQFKSTSWPASAPSVPAYGTKITGP